MKEKMLSRWKNINSKDYFKKALDIYSNLEDYFLDYSLEDVRYVFSGSIDGEDNTLYLNNLENLNILELTNSTKFLENIDKDLFLDILNELDERLFLTCNEIIFLIDKDYREELLDLNIKLEPDDSGVYHSAKNIVVLNIYALMECSFLLSKCYEQFKIIFPFIFWHAFVETLCTYSVHEPYLPEEFYVGGNSLELFHLHAFKIARTMATTFNINIFKEDFLSNVWKELKENPPAPISTNEESSDNDIFPFDGKSIGINVGKGEIPILDALFDFLGQQ